MKNAQQGIPVRLSYPIRQEDNSSKRRSKPPHLCLLALCVPEEFDRDEDILTLLPEAEAGVSTASVDFRQDAARILLCMLRKERDTIVGVDTHPRRGLKNNLDSSTHPNRKPGAP